MHLLKLLTIWKLTSKPLKKCPVSLEMFACTICCYISQIKSWVFEYCSGKLVTKMIINTMLIYRARWKELVKDGMTRHQLSLSVIFKNFPHV